MQGGQENFQKKIFYAGSWQLLKPELWICNYYYTIILHST